jgi:RHS repeat-associated protein
MNQRIRKTVDNIVTQSFFNEDWQELESREPGTASPITVYIWGGRYIDDLVLREKSEERLYSLADPNWNVVALTNTSGNVVERMKYDAFGKITWMDSNFVTKTNSDFAWNRTFTGQVLDAETGLMLYRNRYYHMGLGRFVSRDPIKYDAGDVNIYRYVFNRVTIGMDAYGLSFGYHIPETFGHPSPTPGDNKSCCNGEPYDPNTQCCEDDEVVGRVSIWRCVRPVNHWSTAALGAWHSYICCDGPNNNCFNMASGTRAGASVPKELLTTGNCTEHKVCPKNKDECCDSPIAPWDYDFFRRRTCNTWTNECVSGGVKP